MAKLYLCALYFICSWTTILVHGQSGVHVVTIERHSEESGIFIPNINTSEDGKLDKKEGNNSFIVPKIYKMRIKTNVTNRFARTLISSKVRNLNNVSTETTFSVILPDKSFISDFTMVIGNERYKAYVKERHEARNIYDEAVAKGTGAAHVAMTARESNRFTVSVNVEALSKATFHLMYEELLRRKENMYELVVNIHPEQPVEDLHVIVFINESRPLTCVKTPAIRSGNEIKKAEGDLSPRSIINYITPTTASVKFRPDIKRQKELATGLGTDVNQGLSGQFVVQYGVERDPSGGEVLVQDGYFVHFFAPSEIKPLNKFITFVLDTSGSMWGEKLRQLKDAMVTILDQLDVNDYFHIIHFGSNAAVIDIDPENATAIRNRQQNESDVNYPSAFSGNPDNIEKAKTAITKLEPYGATNIYDALELALKLIGSEKRIGKDLPQPIVMFLTDGEPTVGITDKDQIISNVTNLNEQKTPIFSLSFGEDPDKNFLKKLALRNQGFSRHIYEASDAALQLRNFYKEIASPLLRDVKFVYVPETTSLTRTEFPIYFGGSEIVVSGKLSGGVAFPNVTKVTGVGVIGPMELLSKIEKPVTSLERLWAYLTVQQLLDERDIAHNKTASEKKALDLALKYSFVTPVSSLVVVKPNSTDSIVDPIAADKNSNIPDDSNFKSGVPAIDETIKPLVVTSTAPTRLIPDVHDPIAADKRVPVADDSIKPLVVTSIAPTPLIPDLHDSNEILPGLKTTLPWLSSILKEDGTLERPKGGYQLGVNETIMAIISCPNTPTNTTGQCTLLHECSQVHSFLTSVKTFLKYFCSINKFAGVCCPY